MSIITSFILYILWTILPLGVAVTIFKLFPDTKVSASGPLQNFTINATGAFAAYLITLLAGWFLIDRIDSRIQASLVSPTWELTAKVRFLDTEGKEIKVDNALRQDLKVLIEPPLTRTAELPVVYVRLPLLRPNEWPTLLFTAPGFVAETLSPRRLIAAEKVNVDTWNQTVEFLEELVLQQVPETGPPPKPMGEDERYLQPTLEGPPPHPESLDR